MSGSMDRSATPRASQQQQPGGGRRSKNRSRSGSEELSQIVAQAQANARSSSGNGPANGFWPLGENVSRPQSATPTPHNVQSADQLRGSSPGLLGWVRNAFMMGPSGRSLGATIEEHDEQSDPVQRHGRLPSLSEEPIRRNHTPLLPGILPSFHNMNRQQSLDPPVHLLTPTSARSSFDGLSSLGHDSIEAYDRDVRRTSSISTASTTSATYDGQEDSESDNEDVYAPFAQREHGPSLIRPTARREALGFGPASTSSSITDQQRNSIQAHAKEANTDHSLSIGEAKDAHEFVTDTTEERAIPSLVISSSGPDAPVTGSSGTEIAPPLAGWIDTDESKSNTPRPLDGQEESIQQASHIQHTDADQHVLSRLSLVDAPPSEHDVQRYSPKQSTVRGASDDLRTMTLTAPQHDESYDAFGGDGEDLSDVLGRPKSPEELMRNRQSRESVVLGSRGASVRAGAAAPVRRARAVSAAQARVEDRRSRAPSESAVVEGRSQSLKSPEQGTPVARIQTVDLASVRPQQASTPNRSDGARRKEGSGDLASPVTGSRSRHPLGFLGRRRNVSESSTSSGGVHKRSISLNATETSAKTEGQTNSPFWRLGRKNPVVADPALLKVKEADTSSGVPSRPKQKSQQTAKRGSWNSQDEAKACLHGDSWARRKATRGALGPLMQPRQVRVRSRNKHSKEREFGRMYLAQELFLSSNLGSNQAVSPLASPLLKAHVAPMDASQSGSSTDESADAPTSTMTTSATPSSSGKRRATWAMKFSLDGRYLAVAGQDAIIRVYAVLDTPEARNRAILDAKKNVAADPSPLAACAKSNSTTSLHSTATGGDAPAKASNEKQNGNKGGVTDEREMPHLLVFSPKPVKELKGHTSDILDLSWSKGGFLLSASMDKTARIWHLSWANSLVAFVHGDFVTCAVFHPRDDRFFLSGSLDGKLRLWNVSAKKVQASQEVPGLITACAFTHSGNTACVGTFSGAALFYQTDGLNFVSSVAVRSSSGKHQKGGRKITAIEPVLPDTCARVNNPPSIHAVHGGMPTEGGHELHSERVLITSNDSRVRAYDLNTKSVLVRFKAKSYTNRSSQIRATLSDDNDYIIAGSEATSSSEGGQVHIWASASTLFDASNKGLLAKLASGGLSAVTAANQRTTGLLRSGSRKGNNKDGRSSKSDERPAATLEDVVEYFTAHAGTVTCAIMAPVRSNALLRRADDPILVRGESKLRNRLADSAGSMGDNLAGLPIHLGKTISAALSAPLRLTNSGGSASVNQTASPSSGADMAATLNSKLNRIIVTVDDNAVVRVWRSDNLQTLPMMTSGPRARC